MRQHGHASVNANDPRAWGVCDRCGSIYNHDRLQWQWQWVGPRLQNLRLLVCPSCLDTPQEQRRTFVLPLDPVPIMNARPMNYISANNPMSGIGVSANFLLPEYGSVIGNLTLGGGLNAAFDSNAAKMSAVSASNSISNSSYENYVGVNWQGNVTSLAMPSSLYPPIVKHSILSFTAYAPLDRGFLGSAVTDYAFQGSDAAAGWATWTTISSGTTSGTPGESITGTSTANALYQFHRLAFLGDQINFVSVALLEINVAQIGEPE